jgi:hypothetical protein
MEVRAFQSILCWYWAGGDSVSDVVMAQQFPITVGLFAVILRAVILIKEI